MGLPQTENTLKIVPPTEKILPISSQKKLTSKQKHAIDLMCAGLSQVLTAQKIGVTKMCISHWFNDPWFRKAYTDAQQEWTEDIEAQCVAAANLALLKAIRSGGNKGVKAAIFIKKSISKPVVQKQVKRVKVTFGKPLDDLQRELESQYEIKNTTECPPPTNPT